MAPPSDPIPAEEIRRFLNDEKVRRAALHEIVEQLRSLDLRLQHCEHRQSAPSDPSTSVGDAEQRLRKLERGQEDVDLRLKTVEDRSSTSYGVHYENNKLVMEMFCDLRTVKDALRKAGWWNGDRSAP